MKKIVLILLAFPYLANAQVYETIDSVYTYEGAEKKLVRVTAYTYGESSEAWNEKTQERGLFDINEDGVISDDEEYKVDYTYTRKGDLFEEEAMWYYKMPDGWSETAKSVIYYYSSDMTIIDNYRIYTYDEDKWLLAMKRVTTEYNDEKLPSVQIDSLYFTDGTAIVQRTDFLYNEDGRYSESIFYEHPDITVIGGELKITRKTEYFYNEDGKVAKEMNYNHNGEEWCYSSTIDYEYDERGNCVSIITRDEYNIIDEVYYKYKYSTRDSNEKFFSVQSKAYPNPVSDVLYVTIDGADNAVITLTNIAGSIVAQQKTNQPTTQIPVHSFAKGYYFLTVQTATKTETHKVFIKR